MDAAATTSKAKTKGRKTRRPNGWKGKKQYSEDMKLKSQELHDELVKEVLKTDPKAWIATLDRQSAFIDYSFQNVLMITMHWESMRRLGVVEGELTTVAPRSRWKLRNRSIREDMRRNGMPIFVPMVCKCKAKTDDQDEPERTRVFFRIRWVYDLSQTEGSEFAKPHPKVITGDPEMVTEYTCKLIKWLASQGITVATRPMELQDRVDQSCHGFWSPTTRHIVVATRSRDGDALDINHQLRVLIHEAAHATFGHTESSHITELEAESAAYIVGKAIGLDLGDYSFGYVATWLQRLPPEEKGEVMLKTGNRVTNVAVQLFKGMGFDPRKEPPCRSTE